MAQKKVSKPIDPQVAEELPSVLTAETSNGSLDGKDDEGRQALVEQQIHDTVSAEQGDGAASAPVNGGRAGATGGQGAAVVRGMGAETGVGRGMGGGGAFSLRNLRTFSSFQSPAFRLYYAGMVGQQAAMNMQFITRSLLIYRLTGSATALGLMSLANALPMLCFSFWGGVVADRMQKKHVLLVGQVVSAVVALCLAVLLTSGVLNAQDKTSALWILVGYSVIQGVVFGSMMPSRQAIIPEIVRKDQVMNAVALNMFGQNVFRLLAPALAGFLVDIFGFASVYFTMAGMYVFSCVFVWLLPRTSSVTIGSRSAFRDMAQGFKYVRQEPVILLVLVISLFAVLFSMPYMQLLPLFTEDILKVGAGGLGVLVSVSGIGALVASFVLASLPNKKRGILLLVGGIIMGAALTGFSFSESWALSLGLMLFVGAGQTIRMTLSSSLLQSYVADEYRGRVFSIYMMEFGLTSLSVFFAAVVSDILGVQWAVGGLAMALVLFCSLMLVSAPRIRKLD